jgi:hypothetical protein
METGKAIYKLLKDSADVGAICADRIYPELAQQDVDTPFIVYTVTDTTPSGTKNATSKLDTARVELYCVSDDYETGMNLGIAVRGALDRVSGTVSNVEVQSIDFDTSDIQFDPDQRVYVLEQTYDVRIQRTGTAQVVSQFPGNTFTVEEVDGTPTGAVNKLVFSNGTVTIVGNTATIESGGGGTLIVREDDGGNSAETSILEFPVESITHSAGTATLDALQMLASAIGDDQNVTGVYFANGLVGDFDQDGNVGSADLIIFLSWFGYQAEDLTLAVSRAQAQTNNNNSPFFANAQHSQAVATKTALETAGHVVEYFEGINTALGGGYVPDWEADTVSGSTVRRTLYISNTSFPTSLAQFQVYPLGPYDDTARATVQAVIDAFMQGSTGNVSIVCIRTLVSATPDKLLDSYPNAAAAFSVRLLDKDYTGNAMRIREDSGDTETDIGFDSNGDLDTASIASHCGSANGYVVTWYDQSGNSNNATQSTAGNQPQIYNGTAVITENGKPIIKSNDITDGFSSIAVDMSGSTISMTSVSRSENPNYSVLCYLIPPIDERMMLGQNGSALTDGGQKGFTTSGAELFWNSSSQGTSATRGEVFTQFYQNQTLATWVGLTAVNGTAIYLSSAQSFWQMHSMQEIIFWESDQSTNRTGIETDINTYFSIYP